jgi:predicted transposase/invertase (TIGR01784 family)
MKGECHMNKKKPKKSLNELTLLDRFLFAEVMEDPENVELMLNIILGKEIILKHLPQVEKEERKSPLYRYVRLDVWAQDENDTIYDAEVQKENTRNLPRRSRYYQGMIDSKLLEPGEIDFNHLNDLFIIMITSFHRIYK